MTYVERCVVPEPQAEFVAYRRLAPSAGAAPSLDALRLFADRFNPGSGRVR